MDTPESIKVDANVPYPEGDVPTHENSSTTPVPNFPAGLDSEPKVGDACC